MRLHEKLGNARLYSFLPEIAQDVQQFIVHTHRQVHRQARPQTDTLQFRILLSVGTGQVGLPFADGIQDVAQRGIAAHQRVASRYQDVAYLRVVFEIVHQLPQAGVPIFFRLQFLQLEVQPPALEVVHPLAGSAQASASAPHRVGD